MGFRKDNDVKLVLQGPTGCLPKVIPSDVIPSFAYGRKSRPSTPIHQVVGNGYATQAEDAANEMYKQWEAEKEETTKHKVKLTKASSARIIGAKERRRVAESPEEPKKEWTMSKFNKVQGKMSLPKQSSSLTNIGIAPEDKDKLTVLASTP